MKEWFFSLIGYNNILSIVHCTWRSLLVIYFAYQFSSVQSLSHVRLFVTPWIAARQASLSITNSRSSLRLTSLESVMPSSHLILCRPLLLLLQSLPASESFPMSQLFAWGGQSIGVSASVSVLPKNTQDGSPLVWTGWISLQSKGLPRVFSSTEWSRAKANRVLPRERTGHSKHLLPTTQEKTIYMDITRWSTPKSDWLYSLQPKMEKLYTLSKNKTRSQLWLRSCTPSAKFRLKLKKVGKTTRPFRYDLN